MQLLRTVVAKNSDQRLVDSKIDYRSKDRRYHWGIFQHKFEVHSQLDYSLLFPYLVNFVLELKTLKGKMNNINRLNFHKRHSGE